MTWKPKGREHLTSLRGFPVWLWKLSPVGYEHECCRGTLLCLPRSSGVEWPARPQNYISPLRPGKMVSGRYITSSYHPSPLSPEENRCWPSSLVCNILTPREWFSESFCCLLIQLHNCSEQWTLPDSLALALLPLELRPLRRRERWR